LGQRTERYVGANSTKFTYDGDDVLLDVNFDGSFVKYVNGLGIDDKIRQTVNGQAQYFVQDHLGSTNALTDATGNVISSATYDSFGNATGNLATRYGYTGREKDADTGLYYYRARWYDSNLGRFISEDPIGFKGGDINIYNYAWNSPNNFTDPLGLDIRAYYYRKGGQDKGGKIEVYDDDTPPAPVWVDNPNLDVTEPVGDYEWQYKKEVIDKGIFSGFGDCKNNTECETMPNSGPIPAGNYVIANDPNPGKRNGDRWYALYRKQPDGSYSDFAPIGDSGISRGQFRWHLGTMSLGCLTFAYELRETYRRVESLIQGTSKNSFFNKDMNRLEKGFGTLTVY
jgi:RHS repeat-associated protein